MKHYQKPDGSTWAFELDGSQDHLITADMVPCEQPVPVAVPLTKDQRIAAILSVIPDLTRREVQAIIAITELNAKLELSINGTPIADSLDTALASNSSYRTARYLEDKCRVVDKS